MTALPAVFIVSLEVCASVFACGKPCVADKAAFAVLAVLRFIACWIADFGGWIMFGIFASAVLARLAVFACGIANIRIGRIFGDAGVVLASLVICALRAAAEGRNDCRRFIGTADGE